MVAASAPINSATDMFKSTTLGPRREWQEEAWELFDLVGELECYVRWRARSCKRVKLVASEIDPRTGQPTGSITEGNTEGEKFAAIVHSIAGGALGQAEFIERAVQILGVPGEFHTAILMVGPPDKQVARWEALSKKQIKRSQKNPDGLTLTLPDGTQHEYNPANGDGMFRVWNPHPNDPTEATSPVRSNLTPLREIVRTTAKMENADRSRLGNNGLLALPAEASLPSAQGPTSAGKPGGDPDTGPRQEPVGRTVQAQIVKANDLGLQDPQSHAAITPIVVTVPAEHVDKIKHVTFGKDVSEMELKKREAAILRFARGIDMEPDQLLGLGDTNHWNGYLLADQDVNLHVKPVMQTICQAIYRNVIVGMLIKLGIDPSKYVLTVDASALTADPDKTDEAKDAEAANALKHSALLRYLGLAEDDGYDLTTLEGLQELARDKVAKADPTEFVQVIRDVLPLLDPKIQSIDFPEPPQPALSPAGDPTDHGDPPPYVPVQGQVPDTEGQAPRKPVTAAIGDGVDIVADSYLTRALDLAGKRRVKTYDHDQRARLAARPAHEWHQSLPAVAESEVGRLIAGFDSGLDDLAAKYGFSADDVRKSVVAQARRRLTSPVVDA
ncbi:hypothetical protein H7J75_15990 [Mycolicibacterium canariasense]|nr:hypothetical protein [Mycolicibacterium canariasense]ORU97883.1 hypothetical protein AWB94_29385 [Mycolicibacterium canariasense]